MPYRCIQCFICSGRGTIEIGRNIDDKPVLRTPCPLCNGNQVLKIFIPYYRDNDKRRRTR